MSDRAPRCPFCGADRVPDRPQQAGDPDPDRGPDRDRATSAVTSFCDHGLVADEAVQEFAQVGLTLDFSKASAAALDIVLTDRIGRGGLGAVNPNWRPSDQERRLIALVGSYIGEIIRARFGGKWADDPEHPGKPLFVRLEWPGRGQAWPLERAFRRLRDGQSEALARYVDLIEKEITGTTGDDDAIDWANQASDFIRHERWEVALGFLDRAVTLDSSLAEGWFCRGLVHERLGRTVDATYSYEQALTCAPNDDPQFTTHLQEKIRELGASGLAESADGVAAAATAALTTSDFVPVPRGVAVGTPTLDPAAVGLTSTTSHASVGDHGPRTAAPPRPQPDASAPYPQAAPDPNATRLAAPNAQPLAPAPAVTPAVEAPPTAGVAAQPPALTATDLAPGVPGGPSPAVSGAEALAAMATAQNSADVAPASAVHVPAPAPPPPDVAPAPAPTSGGRPPPLGTVDPMHGAATAAAPASTPDASAQQAALESSRREAEMLARDARQLAAQARFEQAIGCYTQALELDPEQLEVPVALATTQLALGRQEAARSTLETALQRKPTHVPAIVLLARVLCQLGDHDQAIATCDAGVAHASDDARLWHARGQALLGTERLDEAQRAFVLAVQQDPGHVLAWRGRAEAESALGRGRDAAHSYAHYLSLEHPAEKAAVREAQERLEKLAGG